MEELDMLAGMTLDAYLVSRFRSPGSAGGRKWERAVGELLWRPGLSRRQFAGSLSLFGMGSASGCKHELDAAGTGWQGCLIVEAKAKDCGIDKSDLAVFNLKTFDYYSGNLEAADGDNWWRVLVSATEVKDNIRLVAAQLGIILCDPALMPLPVLVRAAGRQSSDQYLDEALIQEMLRLGEPAIMPMQKRWTIDNDELRFKPGLFNESDLRDLIWLQRELTTEVLDMYDTYRPGKLEALAEPLVGRLEALTYA